MTSDFLPGAVVAASCLRSEVRGRKSTTSRVNLENSAWRNSREYGSMVDRLNTVSDLYPGPCSG